MCNLVLCEPSSESIGFYSLIHTHLDLRGFQKLDFLLSNPDPERIQNPRELSQSHVLIVLFIPNASYFSVLLKVKEDVLLEFMLFIKKDLV